MNTTQKTNPRFLTEILLLDLGNLLQRNSEIRLNREEPYKGRGSEFLSFIKKTQKKKFGFKILGQTFNNGEKEEEQDATKRTSLRIGNQESETGKRETMRRNSKKKSRTKATKKRR